MSPIWTIRRLLLRHRRISAVIGVLIVLGVAALNVHAALPAHHDSHGVATVCVAGLSLAVAAVFAWGTRRSPALRGVCRVTPLLLASGRLVAADPRPAARAGPPGPTVLRL